MKVTVWNLSLSGAQPVILGDEDASAAISGFAPQDTPGFRVVNLFRGQYPDIWDNATSSCQFTLTIYREHADAATALRFAGTHRNDIGHVVQMQITGDNLILNIPRAGIVPKCQARKGAGTWFHYDVTAQYIAVGSTRIARPA